RRWRPPRPWTDRTKLWPSGVRYDRRRRSRPERPASPSRRHPRIRDGVRTDLLDHAPGSRLQNWSGRSVDDIRPRRRRAHAWGTRPFRDLPKPPPEGVTKCPVRAFGVLPPCVSTIPTVVLRGVAATPLLNVARSHEGHASG